MARPLEAKVDVELFAFRRAQEAKNIDRLAAALERAHSKVFNEKLELASGTENSMWRDMNVFNEISIPTGCYGPAGGLAEGRWDKAWELTHKGKYLTIDEMYKATQIYAMVAMDICNQEKKPA